MKLLEPLALGPRTAPNRVMFGPHVTNLGDDDRCFTARHVAYYERRARGGCGTIVVEGASVHDSDWPYERAPAGRARRARLGGDRRRLPAPRRARPRLARPRRRPGLVGLQPGAAVGAVTRPRGRLPRGAEVDGARGHRRRRRRVRRGGPTRRGRRLRRRGDQRRPAQPRPPVPVRPDQPPWRRVGHRPLAPRPVGDRRRAPGDRPRRRRRPAPVLRRARPVGRHHARRWRRRSPPSSSTSASTTSSSSRGSIFSIEQTRPDFHQPAGFNVDLAAAVAAAVDVPVVLQGSVVDVGQAEWALGGYDDPPRCDAVEMTRAQIADPDLVAKVRAGQAERIRPVHPLQPDVPGPRRPQPARHVHRRADLGTGDGGSRLVRADEHAPRRRRSSAAGRRGWRRRGSPPRAATASCSSSERGELGGMAAVAGPNRCTRRLARPRGRRSSVSTCAPAPTTCRQARRPCSAPARSPGSASTRSPTAPIVLDVADAAPRRGDASPDTRRRRRARPDRRADRCRPRRGARPAAVLVTQDNIAGNELARSGDLAPANVRLARAGVRIERRALLVRVESGGVTVGDRYSGAERVLPCAALVDCGFRLPTEPIPGAVGRGGRLRGAADRPRGDPRRPARRAVALVQGGRAGPGGRPSGRTARARRRPAGSTPSTGRRPGTGVRHGCGEATGRVANWRQSVTPPVMSPPT